MAAVESERGRRGETPMFPLELSVKVVLVCLKEVGEGI